MRGSQKGRETWVVPVAGVVFDEVHQKAQTEGEQVPLLLAESGGLRTPRLFHKAGHTGNASTACHVTARIIVFVGSGEGGRAVSIARQDS